MSVECSTTIWKRNFNGASRKVVAIKLADHADDEGRGIWPSVERVAAQCDISCRTVQRVLADFVREGILKVVSEGGNGPGDTRRYDFNMAVVRSLPLAVPVPESRENGRETLRERSEYKGDMVSPFDRVKGDTGDAKGDTDAGKGDTVTPKPSLTTHRTILGENAQAREPDRDDAGRFGARGFKRAFAAWPTFVSDSEPAARRAWDGLPIEMRLQAVEGQGAYVASVKASGRSKFCSFAVYLAERRWTKLVETPAAPARAVARPFSPAWGAMRMALLLAGPVDLGPPDVTRESRENAYRFMLKSRGEERAQAFYRRLGCDFAEDGAMLFPDDFEAVQWREHRLAHAFPEVVALHAAALAGTGLAGADAERGLSLVPLMAFVTVGTPLFEDWRAYHEARDWPWPTIGGMRGLYLPAGGPDQLSAFEQAVRGNEHGA